ncbi:MAG: NADH-quinone oxidoreductase subunit NuoF [Clostridia bacterium]|nr:NADH-quinone oxidoreductase subunit NuoF [Clostridia bacterium]
MKSLADLAAIREKMRSKVLPEEGSGDIRVVVGMATCGIAAGARPVLDTLTEEIAKAGLSDKVSVTQTGCIGICQYEPVIEVLEAGKEKVTYVKMTAEKAKEVVEKHLKGGSVVEEFVYSEGSKPVSALKDATFYAKQERVALRNCGTIDPENIDEYIAMDGYAALNKVLNEMTPEEVIKVVTDSGLRGRGGAGFSTGKKWYFASLYKADQKYVVCNADEGDPGAFMDRSILEGDPHCIVEAMAICGYAIGATEGYVYVRAEYPIAVAHLQKAIDDARSYGLLGKNIFGSGFDFDLHIRLGAGAFVCGEETALMTSIEGNRGEPRTRPPFPAEKGLFGKPSNNNNVETYANIPQIILKGAEFFSSMGTETSKGTKVFALGGKINRTGLVEIPMGTTLREIVEDIGGGIPNGKKFKAAQTGGPSGGCIPAEFLDTPIDYESLAAIGSIVGSGGLIIMDEDNCMVDIAKFFLGFTVDESCGKCTPCRVGTRRLYEILEKITSGKGTMEDLDKMEELCYYIKNNSLCALGQTAPNPVLSTYLRFKDEYIAHVRDKKCPAGVCKDLLTFTIDKDACIGCGLCAKNCPASAISKTDYVAPGHKLPSYVIDPDKCVKCGVCMTNCKKNAISKK